MKKYFSAAKKQFSTLALGCALIASTALALVNCADPAPPATFTVTFDTNGGTNADPQTVESGKKASKPTDPTKTDSTFAGWYKDRALTQAFNFTSDKITANITLYAKWVPEGTVVTYTVTFDTNGGEPAIVDKTIETGKTLEKPSPDPTKTDSLFVGWYKDEGLTQRFQFSTERITQPITLYAKWESPTGVTIPDANFRAKLQALIPGAFVGEQLNAKSPEVTGRKNLDVSSADIEDLTGIEYFTALTELDCKDNRLTALDVSALTALKRLVCGENTLTQLDVSALTALQRLVCGENALTQLDVTANTALDVLTCNQNALTRLDVSNNIKLVQLWCHKNQLAYLDIRGVRSTVQPLNLYEGTDDANAIDTLKVHENLKQDDEVKEVKTARGDKVTIATYSAAARATAYTSVCGNYNPNTDACLVEIPDAAFRAKLQAQIPDAFEGEKLNATSDKVTGLKTLSVISSSVKDLTGIQYFTALTKLDCSNNQLGSLDMSYNTQLTELDCSENHLTDLNVSKNTALTRLICYYNRLTNLDVSKNTALTYLNCFGNNLTDLNVSKNTALTTLACAHSSLARLDVSKNTRLRSLSCNNNSLAELDVSINTALTELYCNSNNLTRLDVSTNTALTNLYCNKNRLTYLDVRGTRSIGNIGFRVYLATDETNMIKTLKVHENLKDHAQISAVKTARGDKVKIETYSAAAESTVYTAVCNDYDPTEADEQDRCKDAP